MWYCPISLCTIVLSSVPRMISDCRHHFWDSPGSSCDIVCPLCSDFVTGSYWIWKLQLLKPPKLTILYPGHSCIPYRLLWEMIEEMYAKAHCTVSAFRTRISFYWFHLLDIYFTIIFSPAWSVGVRCPADNSRSVKSQQRQFLQVSNPTCSCAQSRCLITVHTIQHWATKASLSHQMQSRAIISSHRCVEAQLNSHTSHIWTPRNAVTITTWTK